MRRILACGLLALAVAACGSSSGTGQAGPAGGNPGVGSTATPASRSSSGGGAGMGAVDPAGLANLPSATVCTLLTTSEASAILGSPVAGAPSGMLAAGLGTNCLYNTAAGADGQTSLLKIEFNTLGYTTSVGLLKLAGSPQSFTVAGRPAMGVDAPSSPSALVKAQIYVSVLDDPNSVVLYIVAPTLAMAKQAGETVVPRIASLK